MMDETIVEVEDYEEVVGGFEYNPFHSDSRTADAAPFKDPTQNCSDNSIASILRPTLRNSNQILAGKPEESQPMVVTQTPNYKRETL